LTKTRIDALLLPLFGGVLFVGVGVFLGHSSPAGQADFLQVYADSRCIAHHHDPYLPSEFVAFYQADIGNLPPDSDPADHSLREIIVLARNLPSTLFVIAPIAALPWKWAAVLWMAIISGTFILASFTTWNIGAGSAPGLSGLLVCLLLANSELLLSSGNTAALVVSLTVIATCCLLREHSIPVAILCFAIALAVKPQDAGPIWLFFFLAGGVHRKRAIQIAAITAAIALPAVLWVSHSAPHWWPELQSNLAVGRLKGDLNNPGPTSLGARGFGMFVTLQPLFALIRDDSRSYDLCTYAVCAAPLILWLVKTLRSRFSARSAWFALASISALSMLPVYHRTNDAKLLLFAIPACALLWREQSALRWIALSLNAAAFLLTGDLFWAVVWHFTRFSPASLNAAVIIAPLILLATGVFYLCIYLRRDASDHEPGRAQSAALLTTA